MAIMIDTNGKEHQVRADDTIRRFKTIGWAIKAGTFDPTNVEPAIKTTDQLIQDCLDHGIIDVYEDLPFINHATGTIEQPAALRNWCLVALGRVEPRTIRTYYLSDLESARIEWDATTETWEKVAEHRESGTRQYVRDREVQKMFDQLEKAADMIGENQDIETLSVSFTPGGAPSFLPHATRNPQPATKRGHHEFPKYR